jgi:hypothetical protein
MNLIQIQEHLKDLPTQAIMGYANGQNPQVPPYMALGEMNRRKAMEQRAAQAPDSSVKEKLENELTQQTALPGIGQGMNMRMNPAGMPPPMPAAQPQMAPKMPAMPMQPAARPMPPQQMAKPGAIPAGAPGMAAGGLAELPVRKDIFNYAPGGIVAFADESNEQLVLPPGTPYSSTESGTYSEPQGMDKLPVELANKIMTDRLMGKSNLPQPVSRDQVRAEVLAQKPELAGIIDKLPGAALTQLAAKLEEQNTEQRSKFKEGEGLQGLAALSNALINAGEATRGQKGTKQQLGSAFGGFGKSYNAATAAQLERAGKQQALERAQTIETMKLKADIEQMQRAYGEGRIDEAMRLKEQVNAREAKIEEMKGSGATEVLNQADKQATQADRLKQRDEQARHNKEVERYQQMQAATAAQRAKFDREDRPSAEDKQLTKIQANALRDPAYQVAAKKLQDAEIGSEEYYKILDAMRDIALSYYPKDAKGNYKIEPPPKVARPAPGEKPAAAQGFWDKFFNGPKATSPAKPSEVPLPPGFKVVQ